MSILDAESIRLEVDEAIAIQSFIQKYRPTIDDRGYGCYPCIGVSKHRLDSQEIRIADLRPLDESNTHYKDGTLIVPDKTVVYGGFHWHNYRVYKLECDGNIIFDSKHTGEGLMCPRALKARRVWLKPNARKICGYSFEADYLCFNNFWPGIDTGFENCSFNCTKVRLKECPGMFKNLRGSIGELIIDTMWINDVEAHFGNFVIPRLFSASDGSVHKHIRRLADLRAFYNNEKKYKSLWPNSASEIFDINGLIARMGLSNVITVRLVIKDNDLKMIATKIETGWDLKVVRS